MSVKPLPALDSMKPVFVNEAMEMLQSSNNDLEKILLASSLLKWNYLPPALLLPEVNDVEKKIEQNNFSFFIGNIPSYFKVKWKRYCIKNKIGLFYHYCPAFNDALLLEYIFLKIK